MTVLQRQRPEGAELDDRPQRDTDAKRQRVPPHSFTAETALLGAMLLSPDAVADVEGMVESWHFYRPSHGAVFEVILSIAREGGKADAVLVSEALDKKQLDAIGGLDGLLTMQMDTPATSNAPRYAETVRECAMRRCLLETCQEMIVEALEGPCDSPALLDRAREQFLARDSSPGSVQVVPLYDSLDKTLTILEQADDGLGPRGAPTGFVDLDNSLRGGLAPGHLYVVGARPAMGKSALVAEIALNVASRTGPALFVTLEMPDEDITLRLLSSRGRVDADTMLKSKATEDWDKITAAISHLKDAPLYLLYRAGATIADIRRAARQVRHAEGGALSLVVVDYLQLMNSQGAFGRRGPHETRQLEIAEITRSLKVLAGELNCAVLAVSQINRAVETRMDKRPLMSDLRESGAIEQDADVVMLLYRDEVYRPDDTNNHGDAEVNIAKNRHGPEGRVKLMFLRRFTAFVSSARSGMRATAI